MADINTDQTSGMMALYALLNDPLRAHFSVVAPPQKKNSNDLVILSEETAYIGISYQENLPKYAVIQPKTKTENIDVSDLAQMFKTAAVKKIVTMDIPAFDLNWGQVMIEQKKEASLYFQNQKYAFQLKDVGADLSPSFKWGGNTWFGLSGESDPVGSKDFKYVDGVVQKRALGERVLPDTDDDIFSISGEAYIKYEAKGGMTIRFGVTPPIQDLVDDRALTETKWNMQINIPLKP